MKFEKINKDKIKVIINSDDLSVNNMDFNSFMSDSEETHSLFLDVLDRAKRDLDFSTDNYNLKVETMATPDNLFILTITRILDSDEEITNTMIKKAPKVRRKQPDFSSSFIYKFNSFDDFCDFSSLLHNKLKITYSRLAKDTKLYLYNDNYYLVFVDINSKFKDLKKIISLLTEFAVYYESSDIFIAKFYESAKPVFKTKALQSSAKYF